MQADTRLGPYRIVRLINRGGQGTVYLGYDQRLQRKVAIKVYRLPHQRAARRRCLQEARLVAQIHSPKVVQVYDLIDSPEHLALVMEYCPGCDLEELLAAVRPSLASILTISADVAGALAVTRQQRIVHGDLKASNILITDTGRAKLTDFGIARAAGGGETAAGSRSAVSPEQYLGRPMDIRSDLFVLGCLMYRMLTGMQPFCRDGRLDPHLLLEQEPAPLAQVMPPEALPPPALADLLRDLLQKDPAARPANTHRVRRVLREVLRTVPLAATDSLREEARCCFRPESPEDLPPHLPGDLMQEGRLHPAIGAGTGPWRRLRGYLRRPVVVAAAGALALALPALVLLGGSTAVHLERPVLQLEAGIELPQEVSADWLVEETLRALRGRLGRLDLSGPGVADAGDGIIRSPGAASELGGPVPERLSIGLRCRAGLCFYGVTREGRGESRYEQAVLLPETPAWQWRQLIHTAVAALYP